MSCYLYSYDNNLLFIILIFYSYCLIYRGDGSEYIPNDLSLGGKIMTTCSGTGRSVTSGSKGEEEEYLPKLLLLSGPNMGGKSTLLRQTCLIVIMAQLGCKVPADLCKITPVDRCGGGRGSGKGKRKYDSCYHIDL